MFRKTLIILALAGLTGGCIAESKYPLPPNGMGDGRLLGRWTAGNEGTTLEITRGQGPWLIATFLDESGKPAGTMLKMTTTNLNGNDYVSTVGVEVDGKKAGPNEPYVIARYEMPDKSTLVFSGMGKHKVAKDIENGLIVGEATGFKEPSVDDPLAGLEGSAKITASSSDLARYVSQSDPKDLFSKDANPLIRR